MFLGNSELKIAAELVCKGYSKLKNVCTGAVVNIDSLELVVNIDAVQSYKTAPVKPPVEPPMSTEMPFLHFMRPCPAHHRHHHRLRHQPGQRNSAGKTSAQFPLVAGTRDTTCFSC